MTGRPLRPASHHCLGRPLPHQLANSPQPPPSATAEAAVYPVSDAIIRGHSVLAAVSSSYPDLRGRLVTCYSPVRRFTHPKAFAHDLHALSTPLTFALSQDQTLQLMSLYLVVLSFGGPRPKPASQRSLLGLEVTLVFKEPPGRRQWRHGLDLICSPSVWRLPSRVREGNDRDLGRTVNLPGLKQRGLPRR